MAAIERDNASLKGVLPKDFGRAGLDKTRLGQIINLVSDVALGGSAERAKDTLGRVYEYFLSRFASAEGKSGSQFYTPRSVVRTRTFRAATRKSIMQSGRSSRAPSRLTVSSTSSMWQRLLKNEIKIRGKRNVVQARSFTELRERSLRKYQNRAIETAQVIEHLIQLAKNIRAAAE